jgi:hypothetical protein
MQILHRFSGSIQQYSEEISDPHRYRPDSCPQCQARYRNVCTSISLRSIRETHCSHPPPKAL